MFFRYVNRALDALFLPFMQGTAPLSGPNGQVAWF
jgi:hypothetical protein